MVLISVAQMPNSWAGDLEAAYPALLLVDASDEAGVENEMRLLPAIAGVVVMAIFCVGEARADAARGFALAQQWCSGCHAVAPGWKSPKEDAPTFSAVGNERSATAYAVRVFLQTPHTTMPNFQLNTNDVADLADYIMSLKKAR
jgi:mono/diheme cytochrome c family protein